MKFILVVTLVAAAAATEKYEPTNDSLDIEAVVADDNQLKQWYNCFLDHGACNDVQSDFKKDIPEAVAEACAKCTDAQKHIFNKFLAGLKQKMPVDYQAFKARYDPESKHFDALEGAIATF